VFRLVFSSHSDSSENLPSHDQQMEGNFITYTHMLHNTVTLFTDEETDGTGK